MSKIAKTTKNILNKKVFAADIPAASIFTAADPTLQILRIKKQKLVYLLFFMIFLFLIAFLHYNFCEWKIKNGYDYIR